MKFDFRKWPILLLVIAICGCSKKDVVPDEGDDLGIDKSKTYLSDAKENQLKEDVWYYYKVLSLWQDYIPPTKYDEMYKITEDNFIRDNYTQYFPTSQDVLDFLMAKTPIDPSTEAPVDRYTFLDVEGVVSDEIQNAQVKSYGMYLFFLQTPESKQAGDNYYLYVRMVDTGSPAYRAGIRRGDRIINMNGRTDLDRNAQIAQNFYGVNQELSSETMSIQWITPNNVQRTAQMASEQYHFDPIVGEEIFTVSGKKIGYLAFSSFVNVVNQFGATTDMYRRFEEIFDNFQSENVKSLIVDLRYNGGGSTNTAEYLINRLAPPSANGKQMYYYKLNTLLTREWKWTMADSAFAPVSIRKLGTFNVDKIYFLVSRNTASASELLINSLKPYLGSNLQIIGPEKTYGKPVGSFPVEIGADEEAELYAISFQMFNSQGYGDYFGGLSLDKRASEDYFKDFGDPEEGLIANALYHFGNERYAATALNKRASINGVEQEAKALPLSEPLGPPRGGDFGMFTFPKKEIRIK